MPALDANLATTVAGIPLAAPIILAAGTCGVLDEMSDVIDLSRVGAVVTKSITPEPRDGNAAWRIIPAGSAGMLNAIGLANPGLDVFLEHIAPRAGAMPCKVFVSVAGFSVEDYVKVAANIEAFSAEHHACFPAIELNISCPNVKTGTEFGHTPALCREVVSAVRGVLKSTRMFVKLGPMTPEFTTVAQAALAAGADGLTICNTIPAMAIDVESRRPVLANTTGGLSGPGLHPVALRLVHDVYQKVARERSAPILGLGGVLTWNDAAEFILAGASAVQVGTGLFVNPRLPYGLAKGLAKWTRRQGAGAIGELVGAMKPAQPAGSD